MRSGATPTRQRRRIRNRCWQLLCCRFLRGQRRLDLQLRLPRPRRNQCAPDMRDFFLTAFCPVWQVVRAGRLPLPVQHGRQDIRPGTGLPPRSDCEQALPDVSPTPVFQGGNALAAEVFFALRPAQDIAVRTVVKARFSGWRPRPRPAGRRRPCGPVRRDGQGRPAAGRP